MIVYHCPHCGERIEVHDNKAGLEHCCPMCGQPGGVPADTLWIARLKALQAIKVARHLTVDELEECATLLGQLGRSEEAAKAAAAAERERERQTEVARVRAKAIDDALDRYRPPAATPVSQTQQVGRFVLGFGFFWVCFYFLFFDASVPSGDERVMNIGLMADRQNGIIIGCVACLAGLMMILFGDRRDAGGDGQP